MIRAVVLVAVSASAAAQPQMPDVSRVGRSLLDIIWAEVPVSRGVVRHKVVASDMAVLDGTKYPNTGYVHISPCRNDSCMLALQSFGFALSTLAGTLTQIRGCAPLQTAASTGPQR
jgi:hypothetical protein